MGVGKDDPFLAVDMLILDALVDLSLIHIWSPFPGLSPTSTSTPCSWSAKR